MTTLRDPKNPSINQRKLAANLLESEGPGSIAPFDLLDPGIRINKLVRFLAESDPTVFQALVPCQRVGLWEVGFSPVQLFRDYLRAGGELEVGDWAPNPLLGKLIAPYKDSLGNPLPAELFDTSKGLSPEDYQKGGGIIRDSMVHYLSVYVRSKKLHPVIREMFQGFIDGNDIRDLSAVFTADYVLSELAA
jgi:hypothetical protein